MSTRTAIQKHRESEAVMQAATRNLETVAEALLQRLAEDGADQALESPGTMEPLPDGEALGLDEDTRTAIASVRAIRQSMGPVELPDFRNLQNLAILMVAFYIEQVLLLDDVHHFEVQMDFMAREARDEAAEAAYDTLVSVRQVLTGALGSQAADGILGLDGDTPTVPFVLRAVLGSAIRRIRSSSTRFPRLRLDGVVLTWTDVADQLERVFVPLDEAVRAIQDEESAAKTALDKKREILEAYRSALVGWKGFLRGMTIAAGLRDLARELEPTVPGRRSPAEAPDAPEPPTIPAPEEDLPSPPPGDDEEQPPELPEPPPEGVPS